MKRKRWMDGWMDRKMAWLVSSSVPHTVALAYIHPSRTRFAPTAGFTAINRNTVSESVRSNEFFAYRANAP